jgi:osmotically-inducible protein OsmY
VRFVEVIMKRKSDERVRQEILDELRWDSSVEWPVLSGIDVSVDKGVVTLKGRISSLSGKLAAGQAAHDVIGVREVDNKIEVTL